MNRLIQIAGIAAMALTIATGVALADGIIPGNIPAPPGGIIPGNITPPSGGIIPGNVQGPSGGIIPGNVQGPSGGIIPGPTLYSADYSSKKPVAGALSGAKGGNGTGRTGAGSVTLDCIVDGKLSSLLVKNVGGEPLVAGTKLKWAVADLGAKGYLKLNSDLNAGGAFKVAADFSGLTATSVCSVKVI